jgi:fatty acid desaturase
MHWRLFVGDSTLCHLRFGGAFTIKRIHLHTNSFGDPDRQFLSSEACRLRLWYSRIFYPNRKSSKWNFGVRLHFVVYIVRNTITAYYPKRTKPTLVPAKPDYTRADRITVSLELIAILVLQFVIFKVVNSSFSRFIFASPISVLITSSIVMSYIFTNHFLNPPSKTTDALANTTSVIVHPIFDRLHFNFSYHTEHHIFPGMNSNFYPILSNLLKDLYGDSYHRLHFADAWNCLWKIPIYASDDNLPMRVDADFRGDGEARSPLI